ncbi:MAG: TIM44-like domain-containing protein [Acidobacteriia bacterium]|nr:TIM44-like domain-containing protein [Methyloceanibacter sp.]MCL6492232.1 TIM44-like domain-containing protein [Terriglobia bacterium]
MHRNSRFLAILLALVLALAPALAEARAGSGSSMGSRGSRTYVAPPTTPTAPYTAQPMQRSVTPYPAPNSQTMPGYAPGYGYGMGHGGGFLSGLLGGLIGAGIGGLLFGHGFFWGIHGFGSFLGLLLQIFLIVLVVRWLMRRFLGPQPVFAGLNAFARGAAGGPMPRGGGTAASGAIPITAEDYQAFERILYAVQAAWSAHDINALQRLATPEMVGYFAEQLAEQQSRGVRNLVRDVRLERGDLAEAWAEGGREYATVAMRFSMIDVTVDAAGRVVDGSPTERVEATELWTFLRVPGGNWLLSAIQQAA